MNISRSTFHYGKLLQISLTVTLKPGEKMPCLILPCLNYTKEKKIQELPTPHAPGKIIPHQKGKAAMNGLRTQYLDSLVSTLSDMPNGAQVLFDGEGSHVTLEKVDDEWAIIKVETKWKVGKKLDERTLASKYPTEIENP